MKNKALISVVLVVKNEEKNIEKCLSSVKDFADEIVVVDDGSIDKTVGIAKKFTDKIYHHESAGYVEPARNFAISKATGDWILILDADEELPSSLAKMLREIAEGDEFDFVKIPRKNMIFSKWIEHSGWWPDYQIRFFKSGSVKWQNKIHSVPETHGKEKILDSKEEGAILHYNYESVYQFIDKLNNYTTIQAQEFEGNFDKRNLFKNPADEFVGRYFKDKGYEDGLHGLALSGLMSFYMLVVELKIWEINGSPNEPGNSLDFTSKQMIETRDAMKYWLLSAEIAEAKNPIRKVFYKILRRL